MAATRCSRFVFERAHCIPSPALPVDVDAKMVGEWRSLGTRLNFQSVSILAEAILAQGPVGFRRVRFPHFCIRDFTFFAWSNDFTLSDLPHFFSKRQQTDEELECPLQQACRRHV